MFAENNCFISKPLKNNNPQNIAKLFNRKINIFNLLFYSIILNSLIYEAEKQYMYHTHSLLA